MSIEEQSRPTPIISPSPTLAGSGVREPADSASLGMAAAEPAPAMWQAVFTRSPTVNATVLDHEAVLLNPASPTTVEILSYEDGHLVPSAPRGAPIPLA